MVTQTAARMLDLFGLEAPETQRWGEDLKQGRRAPVRKPQVKTRK